VHLAESPDEVEFLRSGHSAIRDLLASRGAWDNAFRPPGVSPVAYLDRLGLLGPATLAVHLVQATGADIALLARRGVAACLCPRSNRATGVGAAPLSALLAANLTVCLGTDSLASNDDLNLFREAEAAIGLGASPEQALRMATLSGAEALSRPELGALSPGRRPQPLLVPIEATVDPVAAVIEAGAQGKVKFLFEFLGMTTTARRPRRPD
jgi:cytosine/adenosine deaminase-related metal-dependent hydrolase